MIVRNNLDSARNLIVKKLKPKEKRIQTTRLAKNQQLNYNKQRFGKKKNKQRKKFTYSALLWFKKNKFPHFIKGVSQFAIAIISKVRKFKAEKT